MLTGYFHYKHFPAHFLQSDTMLTPQAMLSVSDVLKIIVKIKHVNKNLYIFTRSLLVLDDEVEDGLSRDSSLDTQSLERWKK